MKKYKEFWYELKDSGESFTFYFYNTEDKLQNALGFNAETYGLQYCYEYIKNKQ